MCGTQVERMYELFDDAWQTRWPSDENQNECCANTYDTHDIMWLDFSAFISYELKNKIKEWKQTMVMYCIFAEKQLLIKVLH